MIYPTAAGIVELLEPLAPEFVREIKELASAERAVSPTLVPRIVVFTERADPPVASGLSGAERSVDVVALLIQVRTLVGRDVQAGSDLLSIRQAVYAVLHRHRVSEGNGLVRYAGGALSDIDENGTYTWAERYSVQYC